MKSLVRISPRRLVSAIIVAFLAPMVSQAVSAQDTEATVSESPPLRDVSGDSDNQPSAAVVNDRPLVQSTEPLERIVSLRAEQMALDDAVRKLCEAASVELDLDVEAFKAKGLNIDVPVTITIENLQLGKAVRRILSRLRYPLIHVGLDDGKLLVTTFSKWQQRRVQRLPDWLQPLHNRGLVAKLDADRVVEIYVGAIADDELLETLKTLPHLRLLNIETAENVTATGLAHIAGMSALESLQFYSMPLPDDLSFLGPLESLQELSIRDCGLTDAQLRHLRGLRRLRALRLGGNRLTDAGAKLLSEFKDLEVLDVSSSNTLESEMSITDAGLKEIAGLTKLRELDLSRLPISDAGFRSLASLSNLRKLYLRETRVTGGGLLPLARFSHLETLWLGGGAVGDQAMQHVGRCRNLQFLILTYTSIGDEGFRHISKLDQLRKLTLDSHVVTDAGMAHLASLKMLEHVELRASRVTDETLEYLSQIKSLTRLDLSGSGFPGFRIGRNFTGVGYAHLAKLPNLETLWLNNADVRPAELTELVQLWVLNLMMPTMSHDDVRSLQEALPNTSVSATWGGSSIGPDGRRGI